MGDPRKIRRKYEGPRHPWLASRIEEERELKKEFGTKNKREIYRMGTILKGFKDQAKALSSRFDSQAKKEQEQMVSKMASLGLIKAGAELDDILSLSVLDLMNRRLQTVMVKRLLARSPKQARQFISHGHVLVNGTIITSPGYLVRVDEETSITFRTKSPFNNDAHPERFSEEELQKRDEAKKAKAAKQKKTEDEEEAPLVFEDVQDPEEAAKKKEVPV